MTKSSVTLLNGYSSRKGVLGLLTFPDSLEADSRFCRFFSYVDGTWGTLDLDFQCKSLTVKTEHTTNSRAWWLLGKNGEVVEIVSGKPQIRQIPGAGLNAENKYGYVEAIKNIAGTLYVCGYGRQVYKQMPEGWISIADEILTKERGRGFFDMDGLEPSNIYAVGWKGDIYFYDGKVWHRDDSPTTAHLASVKCISREEVWICGDKGVVLHGQFNRWQQIFDPAFQDNWYSIEVFLGTVYLAGNDILARLAEDGIRAVDTGLGRRFTVHRLHASDGVLWAIGREDIVYFDGNTWHEVIHPDNV